jgi:hypothetical protein
MMFGQALPAASASVIEQYTAIVDARNRSTIPRVVVSPYYAWYVGTGRWGTIVPETRANSVGANASRVWDSPVLGFYDSREDTVITAHMIWAAHNGIDVLAVSFADKLPEELLTKAQTYGIKIAPYLEFMEKTHTGQPYDFLAAARNLGDYKKRFPKSLYCIDDKPVIFAYKRTLNESTPTFWATCMLKLHEEGLDFFVLGDMSASDKRNQHLDDYAGIFDGIHMYHVLNTMLQNPSKDDVRDRCSRLYENEFAYARKRNRSVCLTVMPGWDNRTIKKPGMVVDRLNGDIYESMWKAALSTDEGPDMIMITSFNEWYEGGTIEPSITTGSRYLDITRSYSANFKGHPKSYGSLALEGDKDAIFVSRSGITTPPPVPIRLFPQGSKREPAVSLHAVVTAWGGNVISENEQTDKNPVRIKLNGGGRMRAEDQARNRAWYDGEAWDGKQGDWYYRFDGTSRLEAVFGSHHVVVFLDSTNTAIVDGGVVELAYPAIAPSNNPNDVLVPLSLFTQSLGIEVTAKTRPTPRRAPSPPSLAKPRPQAPPVSPVYLEAWRPRLVAKLDALVASGRAITIAGNNNTRFEIQGVTSSGVSARSMDTSITLPWRIFTIEQIASMTSEAATDTDLEALLIAGVWNQAAGETQKAEDYFVRASLIDATAAREAQASLIIPP